MEFTVLKTREIPHDDSQTRMEVVQIHLNDTRALNKHIEETGIRVHPNNFKSGQCIHLDKDGCEVFIFKGRPCALKAKMTVFQ